MRKKITHLTPEAEEGILVNTYSQIKKRIGRKKDKEKGEKGVKG